MMSDIYVVVGSTGDYDGIDQWLVKAFFKEEQAKEYVKKLNESAFDLLIETEKQMIAEGKERKSNGVTFGSEKSRLCYLYGICLNVGSKLDPKLIIWGGYEYKYELVSLENNV